MIRYILGVSYYFLIIFNFFSPEYRFSDLFDPMPEHFGNEHWMLELRFIGWSIITFIMFVSMILLFVRNKEYRKISLISIISIPLFYILIIVSTTIYFEIPIEKMINVYAGNYDSIIGMYLHLGEGDLLRIGIILLGFPLIYSKTLYSWILSHQWNQYAKK